MRRKKIYLSSIFIFCLFIVDRFFKHLVLQNPDKVFFSNPWFSWQLWLNDKFFFGILPTKFWWLIFVFIGWLALFLFGYYWWQKKRFNFIFWLTLIIIGGYSNLFDRIFYQGVVDYLSIWYWPVFNLADIYIVIGVMTLMYLNYKKDNN